MSNSTNFSIIISLCTMFCVASINADGFIKKEVYSFKDAQGNIVFTDRMPAKKQSFKTQIVKSANSTGNNQINEPSEYNNTEENYERPTQTIRVIVEQESNTKKKYYKKKKNLRRCKSYKKKLDYYSDKMNSGYKNSEYKKLEKNRKKYRNLLFKNCDTKTFTD